jgi:hypothetical protein
MNTLSDDIVAYIFTWLDLGFTKMRDAALRLHNPLLLWGPHYSPGNAQNVPIEHCSRFAGIVRVGDKSCGAFPNATEIIGAQVDGDIKLSDKVVAFSCHITSSMRLNISGAALKTLHINSDTSQPSTRMRSLNSSSIPELVLPDGLTNLEELSIVLRYNRVNAICVIPETYKALRRITVGCAGVAMFINKDMLKLIEELNIETYDDNVLIISRRPPEGYTHIHKIGSHRTMPALETVSVSCMLPHVSVNRTVKNLTISRIRRRNENIGQFIDGFLSLESLQILDCTPNFELFRDNLPDLRILKIRECTGMIDISGDFSDLTKYKIKYCHDVEYHTD